MTSTTVSLHPFHTPIFHAQTWSGESPLYRESDNTLHWVDPLSVPPELHNLSLSTSSSSKDPAERVLTLETPVSVIRFCKEKQYEGKYICGYLKGVGILDEISGKLEKVKEIIDGDERRVNDGGIDAKGRF
ncbi:hypothetical protein HYALB_00012598 [Hymenoscyphus albidus]|uniref:SMP-30/Gluconolactonase/LRE-like region domain-containing protein n=1 Tax=Hymenoscyphus albidus TaxID=595503 RepID=A0A9N9LTN6_9HELO|nr:hypothetical protein HYALB_00012598 [Hymenoscyphus albidus]